MNGAQQITAFFAFMASIFSFGTFVLVLVQTLKRPVVIEEKVVEPPAGPKLERKAPAKPFAIHEPFRKQRRRFEREHDTEGKFAAKIDAEIAAVEAKRGS